MRRLIGGLTILAAVGAGVIVSPAAVAQTTATPFDSPTVFCTKTAPLPGTRNSSKPGVTPDSITIANTNTDADALKRVGINIPDIQAVMKVFVDEINKCGGINGRKVILKKAAFNSLAPDLVGHQQAMCIKVTEDYKAFMAFGSTGGVPANKCIAADHKTLYDAPLYATVSDFTASAGRLISRYPASERLASAFVASGVADSLFKGKKITVIGAAPFSAAAPGEQDEQYIKGLKAAGFDADLEILPCNGRVCTSGVGNVVRRMKANGTNLVILTQYLPGGANIGPLMREMRTQGLRAAITGPTSSALIADSVMPSLIASSGSDGAAYGDSIGWTTVGADLAGEWRTGKITDTATGKMCEATYAKALGQAPYTFTEADIASSKWTTAVNQCVSMRAFARAIYSLGNNVTTERAAVALANVWPDRTQTGPYARDKFFYSVKDMSPTRVTSLKFNFPCPLPRGSSSLACFMPVDRPLRFRAVPAS